MVLQLLCFEIIASFFTTQTFLLCMVEERASDLAELWKDLALGSPSISKDTSVKSLLLLQQGPFSPSAGLI